MTPKIIALCGSPKSGKNEVGRILSDYFGAVQIDDGMILRLATPFLFHDVELNDCISQEGKTKIVKVCGKLYTVRQLLGIVGELVEERFGEFFVPEQAMKKMAGLPPAPYYVLTACRKNQGHFYRNLGATVFQLDRDVPKSPHAFDKWAKNAVHATISNRGSIASLEMEVARVMSRYCNDHNLAWALGAGHPPRSKRPQVDVQKLVAEL